MANTRILCNRSGGGYRKLACQLEERRYSDRLRLAIGGILRVGNQRRESYIYRVVGVSRELLPLFGIQISYLSLRILSRRNKTHPTPAQTAHFLRILPARKKSAPRNPPH